MRRTIVEGSDYSTLPPIVVRLVNRLRRVLTRDRKDAPDDKAGADRPVDDA